MSAKNGNPCKKCGTSEWDNRGRCRECHRIRNRQWNKSNPGRATERARQWRLANPGRSAEHARRWRRKNPGKASAASVESARRWREANPDKSAEIANRYRRANLGKWVAIYNCRRTRKTEAGGSYTPEEFNVLCNHYNNKCLRCGRDDVKLTFDHVLPVSKGGTSDISNGQPLCRSCNSIKRDRHIDYRPDAGPLRWLQCKLFG